MLLEKLKNLPDQPGVYHYFDTKGRLLYIGKAKSLKNRVKSYFRFTPHLAPSTNLSMRITKMIQEVANLEYILVESEHDALILENSLIKQLKPKYNILLRDDKTYPYIYINLDEPFPRFEITRKVIRGKNIKYFGPFSSGGRAILDSLYELFPLVQKSSCIKGVKACLFYQIKRCKAPCEGKITQEAYREIIEEATTHIHQKERLMERLKMKMLDYAESLHFEEAAVLKERIEAIESATIISGVDLANTENFDVLAIEEDEERAGAVRLFIRHGKVVSSSHSIFRFHFGFDRNEAYARAFMSFYTPDAPITSTTIYIADHFDDDSAVQTYLTETFGRQFKLHTPQRGSKREIVELARKNAREILKRAPTQSTIHEALKELFSLEAPPYRIECFDNSHLQGEANVGSMVVWEEEQFVKADYRTYNLEHTTEYEQMRELLTRRVQRFNENPPPDLWLIDGGKALRDLAEIILESAGVFIPVVGIAKEKLDAKAHRAKGSAKDILYTKDEILHLKPTDKRLHFCQRIRDEAHRSAITFHRKQRAKKDKQLSLLQVKGIGEAKVKKLLNYFGTFEAIRIASFEELSTVLNTKDAQQIRDYMTTNP